MLGQTTKLLEEWVISTGRLRNPRPIRMTPEMWHQLKAERQLKDIPACPCFMGLPIVVVRPRYRRYQPPSFD